MAATPTKPLFVEEVTDDLQYLNIDTPCGKKQANSRLQGRVKGKVLFSSISGIANTKWTDEELQSLTSFLMLYTDGQSWVAHKDDNFWNQAGVFIQQQLKTSHCRTGASCRTKATVRLAKQFKTPSIAEQHFRKLFSCTVCPSTLPTPVSSPVCCVAMPIAVTQPSVTQPSVTQPSVTQPSVTQPSVTTASVITSTEITTLPHTSVLLQSILQSLPSDVQMHDEINTAPPVQQLKTVDSVEAQCVSALANLKLDEQFKVLTKLFCGLLQMKSTCECPDDFLELSVNAMAHLHTCGRSNVVYLLSQALGTMRPDSSDSLLPAKRMPMGLIEYTVRFYTSQHINEIRCPSDYRSWLQTMYVLFGTKWCNIFSGPLWSYCPISQLSEQQQQQSTSTKHPVKALVNIPAISERTIRRDIASGRFSTGPEIQTTVLEELVSLNPSARWWIKGDGTDVIKGLWQSSTGEWSGDADLNDGEVNRQFTKFCQRNERINAVGMQESVEAIKTELMAVTDTVLEDLQFISSELVKANSEYEDKLKDGHSTDQTMFSLSWDIEELKSLNVEGRSIHHELLVCGEQCTPDIFVENNVARKLTKIRERLLAFHRRTVHFRRSPASHVFVFMLSSDLRDRKPYALPVQCLPYGGLKEVDMRRLITDLCRTMVSFGMNVSGFVSDGEFNYLRLKGYTRPLSVLQIRSDVRRKYSKLSSKKLSAMLTPKKNSNGKFFAETANPAVDEKLLEEIWCMKSHRISWSAIIHRLHIRTTPAGYATSTWKPGLSESLDDQMRSILAQLEYKYTIIMYEKKGIPFRTFMYVPEVHPATNSLFYEREDDAHLLKRMAGHTRSGGPKQLKLQRFVEALDDPTSGLTYPALKGSRKQSVVDAERFFNPDLARYMEEKGYHFEAKFIRTIWNWRRATDERGLSELQRSKFNYQLLNMILDELMPWYKELYDFSLLEVNRNPAEVLGFSKETVVALITNIEGREWHRRESANKGLKPEHPRASTTDDVECFFSSMRDIVGQNFTTKQVKFGIRKVYNEFIKRLDPDLPFFYHTSSHTRFHEGPLPSFNDEPVTKRKIKRVPRREQPTAFAPRRATMPVRGTTSVRPKFHNLPLELPPLPTQPIHLSDHSYC